MLDRFAAFLDAHQRFLLTTHENPDGDGIGASIGLAAYLRSHGKEVRMVVTPSIPENLRWLDEAGLAEAYEPEGRHKDLAAWPDVWLITDASEPHRLGPMHGAFESTKAVRACLDHHLKDAPKGFDQEFTDATASASAELVHDLVATRMAKPWPPRWCAPSTRAWWRTRATFASPTPRPSCTAPQPSSSRWAPNPPAPSRGSTTRTRPRR